MEFHAILLPYKCMANGSLKVPVELNERDSEKLATTIIKYRGKVLDIDFGDMLYVQGEYHNFKCNTKGCIEIPIEIYATMEARAIGPISKMKNMGMLVKVSMKILNKEMREKHADEYRKKLVTRLHTLFRKLDSKNGYNSGYYKQLFKAQHSISSVGDMTIDQLTWAIELLWPEIQGE